MHFLNVSYFFKDLSIFKITEKCSISYHFLFSMYCVVTQFSLRLSCNRNFGKYVSVVNLTYLAFPISLFESNWRNSHIWSPHSFIIFTVLDLKSLISLPNWPEDVFQIINLRWLSMVILLVPHVSRAQRLAPAVTRTWVVRLGAQCIDHWTTEAVALACSRYSWPRMLKVAPCTVVRSYIQIFSAW